MIPTVLRYLTSSLLTAAAALPALDTNQVQFTVTELPVPTWKVGATDYFHVVSLSRSGQWALVACGNSQPRTYFRWHRGDTSLSPLSSFDNRSVTIYHSILDSGLVIGTACDFEGGKEINSVPIFTTPLGELAVVQGAPHGGHLNDIAINGQIVGSIFNTTDNVFEAAQWFLEQSLESASGPTYVLGQRAVPSIAQRINVNYDDDATNPKTTYIAGVEYPTGPYGSKQFWFTANGTKASWSPNQHTTLGSAYGNGPAEIRNIAEDGLVFAEVGETGNSGATTIPRRSYVIGALDTSAPVTQLVPPLPSQNATRNCHMALVPGLTGDAHLVVGTSYRINESGAENNSEIPFIWQQGDAEAQPLQARVLNNGLRAESFGDSYALSPEGEMLVSASTTALPASRRWFLLTPVSIVSAALGTSTLNENRRLSSSETTITVSRTGLPGSINAAIDVTLDITGDGDVKRLGLAGGTLVGSTLTITIPAWAPSAGATLWLKDDGVYHPTQIMHFTPRVPTSGVTGVAFVLASDSRVQSLTLIDDDAAPSPTVTITRSGNGIPNVASHANETITVTFSEAVTGFVSSELLVSGGGSLSAFSGSGTTYTATWIPPIGSQGLATFAVADGAATSTRSSAVNRSGSFQIAYDTLAPAAPAITSPSNEAVVGGSFTVHGTVPFGATAVSVNGSNAAISGNDWSRVFTGQSDGLLNIIAHAVDTAGNVSSDVSISIIVNTANIAVTVEQAAAQADPTISTTVNFTVTFAEAIDPTSFTIDDLTIGGTATGTLVSTITPIGSANIAFLVSVVGMTRTGTVSLSLAANRTQTTYGNFNGASTSVDNVVTWTVPEDGVSSSSGGGSGNGGCGAGGGIMGVLIAMLAMVGFRRRS